LHQVTSLELPGQGQGLLYVDVECTMYAWEMGNGKLKTEIFRERERGEAVLMSQGRAESMRFGIGGKIIISEMVDFDL
jgi:hypothetical protein